MFSNVMFSVSTGLVKAKMEKRKLRDHVTVAVIQQAIYPKGLR